MYKRQRLQIVGGAVLPAAAERKTEADRRVETVGAAPLQLQLHGKKAALRVEQVKLARHSVKILCPGKLIGAPLRLFLLYFKAYDRFAFLICGCLLYTSRCV